MTAVVRNPEFRRNLWVELTPHKLLAIPAILGLAALVGVRLDGLAGLDVVARLGFVLLTLLWGAWLAADAVPAEWRAGTWDGQAMSAQSAWSLAAGKLFGSTIAAWYGGALCVALMLAADPHGGPGTAAIHLLGGVFGQAVAMLLSLIGLAWNRHGGRFGRLALSTYHLSGAAAGLGAINLFDPEVSPVALRLAELTRVAELGTTAFAGLSLLGLLAWALLGLHQSMRRQLGQPNAPWAWAAFVLYSAGYAALLLGPETGSRQLAMLCWATTVALAYAIALIEPLDPIELRRLALLARAGRWSDALRLVPRWSVSLAICALAGGALLAWPGGDGVAFVGQRGGNPFVAAVLLFLLRDALLVLATRLVPSGRPSFLLPIIYLAVLYGLLPPALELAGLDGGSLLTVFGGDAAVMLTSGAAQAAVAAAAVVWRARALARRHGGENGQPVGRVAAP